MKSSRSKVYFTTVWTLNFISLKLEVTWGYKSTSTFLKCFKKRGLVEKNNIYKVGGCVRDSLLGIESKDVDYVIEATSFDEMKEYVLAHSQKIFLEKPDFGIIRYLNLEGKPEDISLCIKSKKSDGSLGTVGDIEEDLNNRDFTMNAIARLKDSNEIIDPNNGSSDITANIIRCVKNPSITLREDPVRIIRAIRFKVQLDFKYDSELEKFMYQKRDFSCLLNVERERLRQELDKCFKIDVSKTLCEINLLGASFRDILFDKHKLLFKVK